MILLSMLKDNIKLDSEIFFPLRAHVRGIFNMLTLKLLMSLHTDGSSFPLYTELWNS